MSAVIEQTEILVDEWVGCYRGGWKGVIVDEAFSHPAKVAFNLARRIYEHAIDEGWIVAGDTIVDPFGGIGGCAFHGLMNGMIVVTNELEEKFVNLSKQNRELWRKQYTGLPGFDADNWIILQGDSRKLASVIREAGCCVSSPPYVSGGHHPDQTGAWGGQAQANTKDHAGYGRENGQMGQMKEGDLSLAISLPPFSQPETRDRTPVQDGTISDCMTRAYTVDRQTQTVGNLAALPLTDFQAAISSPPYNPPMSQDHNGSRGGKRGTEPSETGAFVKYGNSEGQIEGLSMEGFDVAISSPPYEGQDVNIFATQNQGKRTDQLTDEEKKARKDGAMGSVGFRNLANATAGQLSAERGDTFWSASRTILEQLYSVLTPGAHAIFIVKAFVRNKKIVDFPGQWAQLCEAVGFKLIHDHHAMLGEDYGTQGGFFQDKELKVKRVSFFRRLHERKSPETEIHYENVLCFVRP